MVGITRSKVFVLNNGVVLCKQCFPLHKQLEFKSFGATAEKEKMEGVGMYIICMKRNVQHKSA